MLIGNKYFFVGWEYALFVKVVSDLLHYRRRYFRLYVHNDMMELLFVFMVFGGLWVTLWLIGGFEDLRKRRK